LYQDRDVATILRKFANLSSSAAGGGVTIDHRTIVMATQKRRTHTERKQPTISRLIMVAPKQTASEIARRVEIREAMHDQRAKTVRGKGV
jgi:hypothetical protein